MPEVSMMVRTVMATTTWIHVTFSMEGFHFWKEAPASVGYLRHEHRHLFKVKISTEVTQPNRELEFHLVRRWALPQFKAILEQARINGASCEQMAESLVDKILDKYGERSVIVEVWEDDEHGGSFCVTAMKLP